MSALRCDKCGTLAPVMVGEVRNEIAKVSKVGRVRCPSCVRLFGTLTLRLSEVADGVIEVKPTSGGAS